MVVGDGVSGDNTGTYGLFVQRTNNAGTADPIGFGETKNNNLSKRGEMKSYVFDAYGGDRVYAQMASSWLLSYIPSFWAEWYAYCYLKPTNDMNSLTTTLDLTGTYTLIVSDGTIGEDTGTYSLSLQFLGYSSNHCGFLCQRNIRDPTPCGPVHRFINQFSLYVELGLWGWQHIHPAERVKYVRISWPLYRDIDGNQFLWQQYLRKDKLYRSNKGKKESDRCFPAIYPAVHFQYRTGYPDHLWAEYGYPDYRRLEW